MIKIIYPKDKTFRFLDEGRGTMIIDGLCDEIGHDLGDWSIVLSASIENIFDYFVQLIHF